MARGVEPARSSTASSCGSRRDARSRCTRRRAACRCRRRAPTGRRSTAAVARRSATSRRRTPSPRSRRRARRSSSAPSAACSAGRSAPRSRRRALRTFRPSHIPARRAGRGRRRPSPCRRGGAAAARRRARRRGRLAEQRLDGAHRGDEPAIAPRPHRRQQCRRLVVEARSSGANALRPAGVIVNCSRRASPSPAPCAGNRWRRTRAGCGSSSRHRARGVREVGGHAASRRVGKLVEDARFGERPRTAVEPRRSMPMRCV